MISIVHKLRLAKGRNAKIAILERHRGNEYWLHYLFYVYAQQLNYGVRSVKDRTFTEDLTKQDIAQLLYGLEELSTPGEHSYKVALAESLSERFGELPRLAIKRSLNAGITATTINKVYGDIIPQFKVMLANNKPIKDVELPVLASLKYDGVRLIAKVKKHGVITLYTRSGKVINIDSIRSALALAKPGVYDGELTFADGKQKERTTITGAVNKCLLGTNTDIPGAVFNVFDYVKLKDWNNERCTIPYEDRYGIVTQLTRCDPSKIHVVLQYKLTDTEQIQKLYTKYINQGFEGLILRYPHDDYLWRRSDKLIKIKAKLHCVLPCVGVTPGKGKYDGMIGALACEGLVEGKLVQVKVGTGLSDHDREVDPDTYIGHNIDIEYNDIVKDASSDTYSLFLPVFKRIHKEYDV